MRPSSSSNGRLHHLLVLVICVAVIVTAARVMLAGQQARPGLPPDTTTNGRLLVLFLDMSSLTREDADRVVASSVAFAQEQNPLTDAFAVVTVGARFAVVKDFTPSREELRSVLQSPGLLDGTAPNAGTLATIPLAAPVPELTDLRLQGLATVCNTLAAVPQRTAILYFSAGMRRDAANQVELRGATNVCNRANVSIYPVDARGLVARAR